MGYAILRMQKLKAPVAVRRSLKHAFREQDTPNADPQRASQNTHIGAQDVDQAMARFNARMPDKVRKNAVVAVEFLVTGSPEAMEGKSRAEQDRYFQGALDWLRERHGAENVVYAGIHRDETTPHLYAYVVPLDAKGKLNCRSFYGDHGALRAMQTDFAQRVGKAHGLERGIEGSRAHHTTIQAHYAALQRDLRPVQVETPAPTLAERLSPQAYGERVAESVLEQVRPRQQALAARAKTAESERKRRTEVEATAKAQAAQLAKAKPALELFAGLSPAQVQEVAKVAREHQRQNRIAAEAQRRVDQLASLAKRSAGAVHTFCRRALDAIQAKAGEWRRVDWPEVERETIREAVQEHRQSRVSAFRAVLEHSPGQAGVSQQQAQAVLDRAASEDKAAGLKPEPPKRDRGPSLGR